MQVNKRKLVGITAKTILAFTIILTNFLFCQVVQAQSAGPYPLMKMSEEKMEAEMARSLKKLRRTTVETIPPGHVDLLPLISYVPAERDQWYCGNCWVWASTAAVEVALNVQRNESERLSIQYLNSNYNDGGVTGSFACDGGWAADFVSFYNGAEGNKKFIPWSNENADWKDWDGGKAGGYSGAMSNVSASDITLDPSYEISSITYSSINTWTSDEATAINNIKAALGDNKAVWFGFFLPTTAAWNAFFSFWNSQNENVAFDFNPYNGVSWDSGVGGHAVLIVGYDDTDSDPANHYWVALNSWGSSTRRPNGTFRIKMHINYMNKSGSYYNLYWQLVEPTFVLPTASPTPTVAASPTVESGPTAAPTATSTPVFTATPTPVSSAIPTIEATPTDIPEVLPTLVPTVVNPTIVPTVVPTISSCTSQDVSWVLGSLSVKAESLKNTVDSALDVLRKTTLRKKAREASRLRSLISAREHSLESRYSSLENKLSQFSSVVYSCFEESACSQQSSSKAKASYKASLSRVLDLAEDLVNDIRGASRSLSSDASAIERRANKYYRSVLNTLSQYPAYIMECR